SRAEVASSVTPSLPKPSKRFLRPRAFKLDQAVQSLDYTIFDIASLSKRWRHLLIRGIGSRVICCAQHVYGARSPGEYLLVPGEHATVDGRHRRPLRVLYAGRKPMTSIAPHITAFLRERLNRNCRDDWKESV